MFSIRMSFYTLIMCGKTLSLNVDGREYETGMTVVLSIDKKGGPVFAKLACFINIKICRQLLAEKFEAL